MFVEGGWRAPRETPRRRRLTDRQERVLLALIGLNLLLLLIAPIGGSTVVSLVAALFWSGR